MIRSIYVAHPVAPPAVNWDIHLDAVRGWPLSRDGHVALNIDNAKRWIRWLWDHLDPEIEICAPWIPLVEVVPDDNGADRERGIAHSVRMSARCGAIALCGGRISTGMEREAEPHRGVRGSTDSVLDLIHLGPDPLKIPADYRLPDPYGRR